MNPLYYAKLNEISDFIEIKSDEEHNKKKTKTKSYTGSAPDPNKVSLLTDDVVALGVLFDVETKSVFVENIFMYEI